ncbi:GspM family type II secretion system protein LspM [Legionella saoudiensis]|uniref:GspM family type II secretion system protein LspM n=1 Tax=Legionella saoudiensis TaxID=1750561 RepID=UPI00072FD102|nr:GspM family type II secretion system protein LspM [Legionella saoudiensis]
MKAYLSSLNEREKWMVIGAAVCLVLYCYYMFLYTPLSHQVNQKTNQLVEKITTLDWMKKVKGQNLRPKSKETVDNSQLLTILATQLKDHALQKYPYQLQQTGSGDIQLTFEAVPFNLFVTWLTKINEKYALTIKQFNAEKTPTAGVAHVMILLSAT